MAYVAVNKDGSEVIGDSLIRCCYNKRGTLITSGDYGCNGIEWTEWCDCYYNPDEGPENHAIQLPKGSIKKLIGKELTWNDEPIEL